MRLPHKLRPKIVYVVVFCVVMVFVVGSLLVILDSKKTLQNANKSDTRTSFGQNLNPDKLLDIWGTVSKVTESKSLTVSGNAKSVILTVQSDNGKEYQVAVDTCSSISKNRFIENNVEEMLGAANFNEIKSGDRIYLTSSLDLNREISVSTDKVVNIKWFETVIPK